MNTETAITLGNYERRGYGVERIIDYVFDGDKTTKYIIDIYYIGEEENK
jgi:hypothetical protein